VKSTSLDDFLKLTDEQKKRVEQALAAEHKLYHIEQALKKGYVESEKITPTDLAEKMNTTKPLVIRAVYSIWNTSKKPASKPEIIRWVKNEVQQQIKLGMWSKRNPDGTPYVPGNNTIDRCIRACCDPRHFPNQPTPIIRLVEGKTCLYMPNPALFDEETKQEILKIMQTK